MKPIQKLAVELCWLHRPKTKAKAKGFGKLVYWRMQLDDTRLDWYYDAKRLRRSLKLLGEYKCEALLSELFPETTNK